MRSVFLVPAGVLLLVAAAPMAFALGTDYPCIPVTSATGTFTEVAVPGALETNVQAVNDAMTVVGTYRVADETGYRSFVLEHGEYTDFAIPGATQTVISDINSAGVVVGTYHIGREHGFILKGSTLVTLDAPGALHTSPQGINDAGVVVGNLLLPGGEDGLDRGFVYWDGQFEIVHYPESFSTVLRDVNDPGSIVGGASFAGSSISFVWDGKVATPLAGCDGSEIVAGITNQGNLFGTNPITGVVFIQGRKGLTTLVHPDAISALLMDVNSAGVAVGTYYDGSAWRSFLFVPR